MHSAIVAVELPGDKRQWSAFQAAIQTIEGNQAVSLLGENVWQIDFQKAPLAFALLVKGAEDLRLPYRILSFDAEPRWLRVVPNPKPT